MRVVCHLKKKPNLLLVATHSGSFSAATKKCFQQFRTRKKQSKETELLLKRR